EPVRRFVGPAPAAGRLFADASRAVLESRLAAVAGSAQPRRRRALAARCADAGPARAGAAHDLGGPLAHGFQGQAPAGMPLDVNAARAGGHQSLPAPFGPAAAAFARTEPPGRRLI